MYFWTWIWILVPKYFFPNFQSLIFKDFNFRAKNNSNYFQVYFGTSHARMYLSANFLGINCATGMSALMRKDILEAEGGLQAFGKYLAEDYFIAKAIQARGLHTVICSQPALQNAGDTSVTLFQNRLSR